MKKWVLVLMLLLGVEILPAQEFRCTVSINSQKLTASAQKYETTDQKIFETMKQAVEDFVNLRKWTNLDFEEQEKLDCSISIILTQRSSATDFSGQFSVQLRRPVYNSNYSTGLFNYLEGVNEFTFTFNESQPLEFDQNTFYDNLSSTVAYYVYIMLGMYFDSFAPLGGDAFYEVAQTIQQTAAGYTSVEYKGWQEKHGQKARMWFANNAINSAFQPARQAIYDYHRQGLDLMTKDQTAGRANIIKALTDLQQVHKSNRNDLLVTQFVDVKVSELISIFTPATDEEKRQVYLAIKDISPISVSKMKDWKIDTR